MTNFIARRSRRVQSIRQSSATLVALLLAAILVGIASAHVTVNPNVVLPGSFDTFNVRVPTEKEEPTVKVRIEFPAGLLVSRFQPKPGWKRDVEKDGTGRIAAVTWSGGSIAPDEYEDFAFLARAPNQPGTLTFKAYQTYQSGDTVNWVEAESGDNPAPIVQVSSQLPSPGSTAAQVENPSATVTVGVEPATSVAMVTAAAAMPMESPTVALEPTSAPVATEAAVVTAPPAGAADSPSVVGTTVASSGGAATTGSDLPLFISLGALVLALIALALGGIAVARRGAS